MRTRFILLVMLVAGCGRTAATGTPSAVKAVDDISSMTLEPDGRYRVVCKDARVEYRSAAEIRADRVCERGGGGGGDGIVRCVARDNDGRDPWIMAKFGSDGGLTRFPDFVFSTLAACQDTANSLVRVGFDTHVFCAARDRDGRDPWSYGVIAGSTGSLATAAVFGTIAQCNDSLRRARVARDFLLTCTSRDADGRDPWSFVTVNSQGQVSLQTDAVYNTFEQCMGNL